MFKNTCAQLSAATLIILLVAPPVQRALMTDAVAWGKGYSAWTLGDATFQTPTSITPGQESTLKVRVTSSPGMSTTATVTLNVAFTTTGGDITGVKIAPTDSLLLTKDNLPAGSNLGFPFTFTVPSGQPAGTSVITARVSLTNPTAGSSADPPTPKDSTNTLTVVK